MTSLLEILRTCAWIVLAAALAVLCRLLLKDVDVRRMKSLALLRLPASVRWAFAVLALAGFFVAGGKPGGTNGTDRAAAPVRTVRRVASGSVEGPQGVVTDADVAAGWRVVSVSSNAFDASVFAMPTNAVVWEDARVCGAGFGAWRMPAGWRFPFGGPAWTNAFLWVEGLFRARFDDRSDEIRLLDERLTLCPEANWPRYGLPASRAWAAVDGNGGLVATFENAALGDDPAKIVCAQLALDPARAEVALRYDLRAAGAETRLAGLVAEGVFRSVAVGSNTSEVVFRRVHPDDWDWDGLPDTLDDEPHVPRADGPVWGQSAEWACLAFPSNAAEIAAAGGYLAWAAARGGEPNRHLVGLAIESPDDVWPISVRFGGLQVMCDRAETLYFAIDDGAKYAFELSEGRLRSVTVGDEDRVDGLWEDWFHPWEWCVWPTFVTVHMDSARTGWIGCLPDVAVEGLDYAHFFPGDSLAVTARVENCHADSFLDCSWSSPDPGVSFSDVQGLGTVITWQNPGGVVWATNRVTLVTTYAGDYAVTNGYTVSVGPSPSPATTLEVSCPAVQFLNDGIGGDRLERVYKISLRLLAARGTRGRVALSCDGTSETTFYHDASCLQTVGVADSFPIEIPLSGGFATGLDVYMTSKKVGTGAVCSVLSIENDDGQHEERVPFEVIEPIRRLVNTETFNGYVVNPPCLVAEGEALLKVGFKKSAEGAFSANDIRWTVVEGPGIVESIDGLSAWVAPTSTYGTVTVEARFNGDSVQPRFVLPIVRPRSISVRAFIVPPPEAEKVESWAIEEIEEGFRNVNLLYGQLGITFNLEESCQLQDSSYWRLPYKETYVSDQGEVRTRLSQPLNRLINLYQQQDCVEVYFIGEFVRTPTVGLKTDRGLVITKRATWQTLAHELGHALGLSDCYEKSNGQLIDHGNEPVTRERFLHFDRDWGRETGRGFYEKDDTLEKIIRSYLMHGVTDAERIDIPYGAVHAWFRQDQNSQGFVPVGTRYFKPLWEVYSK